MALPTEQDPSPQDIMFAEALAAVESGDRSRARDLLTRLLKVVHDNPEYWVWMSAVVDTPKERIYCLREAIRLDPSNAAASRGLVLLGATPPDPSQVLPARLQKRSWQSKFSTGDEEAISKAGGPGKAQYAMMALALLAIIGLVAFAFLGVQKQFQAQRKRPLVINLPTNTVVAAAAVTPTVITPTPDGSPAPLWMQLQATYTPTPLYINTPHASIEAYRIGMRHFQQGNWASAREMLVQVTDQDPGAMDVYYYIGESYRMEGNLPKALETFNQAIEKHPNFAPLYVGRSRARIELNPKQVKEAIADLELAVKRDRGYGEAYLDLSLLQLQAKDYQAALSALKQAETLLPESPLVYLNRARIYLAQGDEKLAMENARRANQLDITLVFAYRVIGEVLQAEGDVKGSLEPLSIYLQFEEGDAVAWMLMAKALLADKNIEAAREAVEQALALDKNMAEAYLIRAEIYLQAGEGQKAWADYRTVQGMDAASFEANLGIGKALMLIKYPGDAYMQFERTKAMAKQDRQKAELLYWRALSLDELNEAAAALRDWQALLEMPEQYVQPAWAAQAEARIKLLASATPTQKPKTSTPTVKATSTRKPTLTATATATRRPTLTPTATPTPKPSRTLTATPASKP